MPTRSILNERERLWQAVSVVEKEHQRIILEVKSVTSILGVSHFEISVALNHDVDDLLIGIIAEIKESYNTERVPDENKPLAVSVCYINRLTTS